jgi:hypothetical protein
MVGSKTEQISLFDIRGGTKTPAEEWSEEQINKLVCVGMTRARYQLFIPYIRNSPIIEKLQSS